MPGVRLTVTVQRLHQISTNEETASSICDASRNGWTGAARFLDLIVRQVDSACRAKALLATVAIN